MRFLPAILIFTVIGVNLNSVTLNAEEGSLKLVDVLRQARSQGPELQLRKLETMAQIRGAEANYGKLLPEVGVEGGHRTSRERTITNYHFYYAYGRYELGLQEIYELRGALAKRRLAERETELIRSQLERFVAEQFYESALRQERINLKEEDLKLSDQQLQTARRRIDGGLATNTDLLEFQLHQQELRNDLKILRQELVVNLRELQRMSGLASMPGSLDVAFPLPSESLPSEEEMWSNVSAKNFELSAARAEVEVARAEKGASLGGWLPRVSVEGQYGKLLETDFDNSRQNSWEVIGKVTLPLFSGAGTLRKYQSKSAEAERAELKRVQEEVKVRNALKNLSELITRLRLKLDGEQTNVKTSEAYYRAVMAEYKRGVKNSPDVAGATDKLFEAKERLLETRKDLSLTYLELLTMQGRTLED